MEASQHWTLLLYYKWGHLWGRSYNQLVIIFITYFSVNCFSHLNESFREQTPGLPCSSLCSQPASRAVAATPQDHSKRMHGLGTAWLQTPSTHLEELWLNLSCQEWAKCRMDHFMPPPKLSASSGPPPHLAVPTHSPQCTHSAPSTAQTTHLSHKKGKPLQGTG